VRRWVFIIMTGFMVTSAVKGAALTAAVCAAYLASEVYDVLVPHDYKED
jgi:hypothetical protein